MIINKVYFNHVIFHNNFNVQISPSGVELRIFIKNFIIKKKIFFYKNSKFFEKSV